MKFLVKIMLIIIGVYPSMSTAESFELGETVLADCHGFFAKGKIKRKQLDKYVIHFNKDARPIMCVPFAWDDAFIVKYKPVGKYTGQVVTEHGLLMNKSSDVMLKTGDNLNIKFKVLERDHMLSDKYAVSVKIKEINSNGAALLEVVAGGAKAQQVFDRWVGTNYVTMDFTRSLKADRLTFLEVSR